MVKTYTTKSGETFDSIAYEQMGDCKYTEILISANRQHIKNFIFRAGVELIIPEVDNTTAVPLPPWRLANNVSNLL